MQDTLKEPVSNDIDVIATSPNEHQENAILNALSEGVFIAVEADDSFKLTFTNNAMRSLLKSESGDVVEDNIFKHFMHDHAEIITQGLAAVLSAKEPKQISLSINDGRSPDKEQKHVRITMVPDEARPSPLRVICIVHDVTALANRAMYLEDRAVKLLENTNFLETSRRDLEKEILRLRTSVKTLERSSRFDAESGLPNRAHFLERATAEFQRSRRYEHNLSLVLARVAGYQETIELHGEDAGKKLIIGLAQLCETASRYGIDFAGRISQNEIVVLLPETNLTGSLLFVDRLTTLIAETPLQIGDGFVRLGIRTSMDCVQSDDHTFMQAFTRAQASL